MRRLLPYIYCPLNALLCAKSGAGAFERRFERYYNVMLAFTRPFMELLEAGQQKSVPARPIRCNP